MCALIGITQPNIQRQLFGKCIFSACNWHFTIMTLSDGMYSVAVAWDYKFMG